MRYPLIIAALVVISQCVAQDPDLDRLMKNRFISCPDIFYNCASLIPSYYKNQQFDSIRIMIDYWKARCGSNEPNQRAEILLNIHQGTFNSEIYPQLLGSLLSFKLNREHRYDGINNTDDDLMRWGYVVTAYDDFTKQYALTLKDSQEHNSLTFYLCEFYSGNYSPLFEALKRNQFPETSLQQNYNDRVASLERRSEAHVGILAEYWMPDSKLKLLGNHPGFGFQSGFKKQRVMLDFTLLFRFLNSKNVYEIRRDSLITTRHFFGGYIGADLGYEIVKSKKSSLAVLGGIAFDGFDALKSNPRKNIKGVSINSLNLNGGLGYRYYYNHANYAGLQLRYNLVNYHNKGGTDLSGNTITLRLLWGISQNVFRDYNLKALGR